VGKIEVDLQYFKNDVKRIKGTDINIERIKEIGKNCKADMNIKEKTPSGFPAVLINVASDDESALRQCVKEIVSLYGKPEVPSSMFGGGSKKRGKEIANDVIREVGAA